MMECAAPRGQKETAMSYETPAGHGLAWGVKASFRQYLESTGDAQWGFGAGAALTQHGELYFPLARVDVQRDADGTPTSGTLSFDGKVSVSAHFGMLDIVIDAPSISFGREGAALSAQGRTLAKLSFSDPVVDGDVLMWHEVPSTLAMEAVALFGGSYGPGTAMDPLTVRMPLPERP